MYLNLHILSKYGKYILYRENMIILIQKGFLQNIFHLEILCQRCDTTHFFFSLPHYVRAADVTGNVYMYLCDIIHMYIYRSQI